MPIFTVILSFIINPANRTAVLVGLVLMVAAGGGWEIVRLLKALKAAETAGAVATLQSEVKARDDLIAAMRADDQNRAQRETSMTTALGSLGTALGASQAGKTTVYRSLAPPVPRASGGGVDTAALEARVNEGMQDYFDGLAGVK